MGAKTWMLVYCDTSPKAVLQRLAPLDREATAALARQLFPSQTLTALEDVDLSNTCPRNSEIAIGCFDGIAVLAAEEIGIDLPSELPAKFLQAFPSRDVYFHAMHSTVDWLAFAIWKNGRLARSLSLSPDSGVIEDIGDRLPFELPYWSGKHPALDPDQDPADYPFPFHPLELGEAALLALFGYRLEGSGDAGDLEPESIPLMRFKRQNPWWRFW